MSWCHGSGACIRVCARACSRSPHGPLSMSWPRPCQVVDRLNNLEVKAGIFDKGIKSGRSLTLSSPASLTLSSPALLLLRAALLPQPRPGPQRRHESRLPSLQKPAGALNREGCLALLPQARRNLITT